MLHDNRCNLCLDHVYLGMRVLESRYEMHLTIGNYDRLTSVRGADGKVCEHFMTYPDLNDLSVRVLIKFRKHHVSIAVPLDMEPQQQQQVQCAFQKTM